MPLTLKTTELQYKDSHNVYHGINAVAEKPTADVIADLDAAIEERQDTVDGILDAQETRGTQITSAAQSAVDGIEGQKDTMIASIASVAGMGTDTTLTQSGVAADAKVTGDKIGDLKSAVNVLNQHFHNELDFVIGGYVPDLPTPEYAVDNRVRSALIQREFTKFHVGAGFNAYIFYFDANQDIVSGVGQTWQTEGDFTFENYPFIRVLGRYMNNADFTSASEFDFYVYSAGNVDDAIAENAEDIQENALAIERLEFEIEGGSNELTPVLVDGYVGNDGSISNWGGSGGTTYKRTDYINLNEADEVEVNATYYSAFYNESKEYIAPATYGASTKRVPTNAKYIVVSYRNFTGIPSVILKYKQPSKKIVITCHGDSVTEGMNMADAGTAVYGGDTYPSQLLTMLTDNGYNVDVKNYGHGGERSSDIAIRVGGSISAYLTQDVTIPAANPMVSIGKAYVDNYKVIDSQILSTAENADGTPCGILFTQTGRNTRPLMIGDKLVNLYQSASGGKTEQFLQLVTAESADFTFPAGTIITTGGSVRNQDICIVYMGINDGSNLTMDEWIKRNKSAVERHPNTIVLGATNGMWTFWSGMTGTDAEKRAAYLRAVAENFGSYYIDLYDIFTTNECIRIANAGGYLTDRTVEQIAADNEAFASHKTPPSLTESGAAGNVHFNAIGYYVLAKVIYEKLINMGLIV